jgi:hypothetical protein
MHFLIAPRGNPMTALHADRVVVKFLLKKGADVNAQPEKGQQGYLHSEEVGDCLCRRHITGNIIIVKPLLTGSATQSTKKKPTPRNGR